MTYDKIILGAGLYGLYAAQKCGAAGQRVLVLERDPAPFMRATYINQARVHMGYHYPRSYSTAIKSAHYFERFCNDYGFCLHTEFDQVYATSAHFSWTNAAEFRRFCAAAGIRCDDVAPERYFNPGLCDGAFLTTEYTYDAQVLKRWFLERLAALPCGLGLGLPLCRRIAEGHGGRMVLDSRPDQGTSVTLALPDEMAEDTVEDVQFDYAGGFQPALVGLAAALPYQAFLQKHSDD